MPTQQSAWSVTQDSAANGANNLSKAAVSDASHYVTAIGVSLSGAASANDVTVDLKDGNTILWREVIGSGAVRGTKISLAFPFPIRISYGAAATLAVVAAGAGAITSANLSGYTY